MTVDQKKLLARLLEITSSLSNVVDLEAYMQSILTAATELTGSETVFLMEYDEAAEDLYYKYVSWFHSDSIKDVRVPLNESAAGWVFLHVQPLMIDDVKNDPRHYRKIDALAGF